MIYGLYLSASGVLTSSYRQDVIANNLANAQTVGFKRSLALVQQRRTEAQSLGKPAASHPMLEAIGGGLLLAPTYVDHSQGALEQTHNNLDLAIHGRGFFAIKAADRTFLTRNGQFMVDRQGYLILADGSGHRVLDREGKEIWLNGVAQSQITVSADGTLSADGQVIAQIGVFDVPDPSLLTQRGGTLLSYPDTKGLKPASATVQSGFVEQSNVEPTTELVQLISAQRQFEANVSMIRYQDQTLGKLVNEVGKIG